MDNGNDCQALRLLYRRRATYREAVAAMERHCADPDSCRYRKQCVRQFDSRCELWEAPRRGYEKNTHQQNQRTTTRRTRPSPSFETTAPDSMRGSVYGVFKDSGLAGVVLESRRPFSTRGEDDVGEL